MILSKCIIDEGCTLSMGDNRERLTLGEGRGDEEVWLHHIGR